MFKSTGLKGTLAVGARGDIEIVRLGLEHGRGEVHGEIMRRIVRDPP